MQWTTVAAMNSGPNGKFEVSDSADLAPAKFFRLQTP